MENYVSKGLLLVKGLNFKKMNMKTSMALLGFLFLSPINSMAQDYSLNKEVFSQRDELKRKDEVSKIVHGHDETKFQKALVGVVIKNISILQYGAEGKLSMAEEVLIHANCRTEREAGDILAPYFARAFFSMSEENLKSIIKGMDDELKIIRKLRTPIEVEANELGL